jgi:hypothetical protein
MRRASKFFVSFVCFAVNFTAVLMNDERKNLEQREQMTDLGHLRHSAWHGVAMAILKIWPEV